MKEDNIVIDVNEKGVIQGFGDEIELLFEKENYQTIERKRVSHIVPENILLRFFFKLIRSIVSDESKAADWTRQWKCRWIVVIDNQWYGPFYDRKEAVRFEKKLISNSLFFR